MVSLRIVTGFYPGSGSNPPWPRRGRGPVQKFLGFSDGGDLLHAP